MIRYPIRPGIGPYAVANLTKYGCVHLVDATPHGLTEEVADRARELFENGRLRAIRYDETDRTGYYPPSTEVVRGAVIDTRETFDYRPGLIDEPSFKRLYDSLVENDQIVMDWIDEELQPKTKLADFLPFTYTLRLAHQCARSEGPVAFPQHFDFSLITVFAGGAQGLRYGCTGSGKDPRMLPKDILVGVGTALHKFFGDLKPLNHWVEDGRVGRVSAFLFCDPHDEQPLPDGRTFADFLAERLEKART